MLAFYTLHSLFAWIFVIIELLIVIAIFLPKDQGAWIYIVGSIRYHFDYYYQTHAGYPHDFGGVINVLSTNLKLILLIVITILSLVGFGIKLRRQKFKQQIPGNTIT